MVRKKLENHQAVAHSRSTFQRIQRVRLGKKLRGSYHVFGAAYRLLDLQSPSPTVTRSGFRDFVHPRQDRVCTVRELARLQSFPDEFVFRGRRCDTYARSRYIKQTQHEQIGNAVPPLLAEKVAKEIRRQLVAAPSQSLRRKKKRFDKIFQALDDHYPKDRLGNKGEPLDELIYIVLSRRTRENQYQAAYRNLREHFRSHSKLAEASNRELREILKPLGLVNQRVAALKSIFATIQRDFGRLTLAPLKKMTYSEAFHYLRSLPGVNDKTAKCVMLYALSHPALPVDTHTYRVSERLGLFDHGTSLFLAPRALEALVPRQNRGRYHVLTVLHGREVCTPRRPLCSICLLKKLCSTPKKKAQ